LVSCLNIFAFPFYSPKLSSESIIDRHEISLVKTLFGRKVNNQRPTPRREIAKLIFTREHFYVDAGREQWKQPAELSFQIGIKPIMIGGHQGGGEDESEVEWLANEVSEWLDKPLTVMESSAR
jgi:hypothetical protein